MSDAIGGALIGVVGTIVGGVLVWFLAMTSAAAAQDREVLRKQRGLAAALLADIRRIETALGPVGSTWSTQGVVSGPAEVASVHPWVEGLIAQIAEEAPDVVVQFMNLERELASIAAGRTEVRTIRAHKITQLSQLHEERKNLEKVIARGAYNPRTDQFIRVEEGQRPPSLSEADVREYERDYGRSLSAAEAAEAACDELDGRLKDLSASISAAEAGARVALDHLSNRLGELARREVPSLTHLVLRR